MLLVENTTGGGVAVIFEADLYGAEQTIYQATIGANESRVLGPLPADRFNDRSTTEAASNGYAMVRQASGTDGQLTFQPFAAIRKRCLSVQRTPFASRSSQYM